MLARPKRGEHVAVFCLDLDRFKDVNDAHGHPVGDLLLKSVAARLRQCIRDADMVARLGGDEFAIVRLAPLNRQTQPRLRRVLSR